MPAENAAAVASEGSLNFTWNDNSGVGNASAGDLAMPLIFNSDKGESIFSTEAGERSAGSATMNIPDSWMGDTVEIYLGFISEDGATVANSAYLGQQTIA